jgi:hypothetical protein
MLLETFNPPGFADDLDAEGRKAWHQLISSLMDDATAGDPSIPNSAPRPQFFNPSKTPIGNGAATEDVKWTAFPRLIALHSATDQQRWQRADASRDVQDEYCEWSVKRESDGTIVEITFTCEGPEYWDLLAQRSPEKVLELYRTHIDPNVAEVDLFDKNGVYIKTNKWNNSTKDGAMHLIQRNNTLGAEIELAGAATIVRSKSDGSLMVDTRELIECGKYGVVERNSDPFIGARVNHHARNNAEVTIADPVGIYFASIDTQSWETPDDSDPAILWCYTRGAEKRPMRAVLKVPEGKSYHLGDVMIKGKPITFGAQVADCIQMSVRAVATRIGQSTVKPVQGCVGAARLEDSALDSSARRRPSRIG